MKHRLYIVEGPPCSGKSTTSAYIASVLRATRKVCFVDEGSGDHPADYEFHALAPAGLLSDRPQIVKLSDCSGALFDRLLSFKIYDALPWETEMPLMLDKWRQFVKDSDTDTAYVFNCVLLQNPMCETMMRFGFSEEDSRRYIGQIAAIIAPMDPLVVYLKNDDIAGSVKAAAAARPGWLDGVIDYHISGAYGKSIHAGGFDGYIDCLAERQKRELRILSALRIPALIVEDPQRDWDLARERIKAFLTDE